MKLYCGIDLHSNNSVVAVTDEDDRVVVERRVANDLQFRGQYTYFREVGRSQRDECANDLGRKAIDVE